MRLWAAIHKWASLICTVFLLVICLTGLPLIFHEEIDGWLNPTSYARVAQDTPRINLDRLTAQSRALYPGNVVIGTFVDDDEPQVIVYLAPSWAELQDHPSSRRFVRFDAHTGTVLEQSQPSEKEGVTFLGLMLRLHTDLFAGLPGELFMGAMALLFVTAIVSGIVLYGPFTRKLNFGSLRTARTNRVRWLDLHNLLGVVTLAWALVAGLTGAMNELSTPLFTLWQRTDVAAMVAPWKGKTPPAQSELSSVQAAFETTRRALPGMIATSITYPGGPLGSPHHYLLFTKGKTQLTSRLFSPVLIDARTGKLTAVVKMPWYLRALEVSRPLHFGDYGGMPLKVIWALLDLVTIVVLGSGLYLWIARPRREKAAARREILHGASPQMEAAE
ncbi:membrane protein [Sphingobium yanoikuyae]|nr:membrane protein [Sphingobium yanoikuyae]